MVLFKKARAEGMFLSMNPSVQVAATYVSVRHGMIRPQVPTESLQLQIL